MQAIIEQLIIKLDAAKPIDIFYICLAFNYNNFNMTTQITSALITSDFCYAIYLKSMEVMKGFDLYQIS